MFTQKKHTYAGLVLAVATSALVVLSGCSASTAGNKPPTDGVLTVGLLNDIGQPPDPDVYYANNGLAIVTNVYEGLVEYKPAVDKREISPRLAESWTVSPDNTVFTFKLRSGMTFHDGTPVTAAAVKTSFDRRLKVSGGAAYMVQGVKSITTPDNLTAVVTLSAPNAAFLDYLASGFGPKLESPTCLQKNAGSDDAQTYLQSHDCGSGPYELTGAEVGTQYTLKRYDGYWGTKSPFTTVQLPVYTNVSSLELALKRGTVDLAVQNLPSSSMSTYTGNKAFNSYLLPTFTGAFVFTNPSKAFFATREARTAFQQVFDRPKLVSEALGKRSTVSKGIYPAGIMDPSLDPQTIAYDPKVMESYAKSLPKGTKVTLGYASESTAAQQIANIVSAQLQQFGLQATAQSYPTSQIFSWSADPTKGPDAFIDGNNGPDGGDPYMFGHVFWDKTGGINYFGCDDPATDSLLNRGVATGDTKLYAQAATLYSKTGCYLNLAENKDWIVSQSWLQGVEAGHTIGFNEVNFSKLSIKK